MRFVAPDLGWPETVYAKDQPPYQPITVAAIPFDNGDAGLLIRVSFDERERRAIAEGADVYFMNLYPGKGQPGSGPIVMTPVSARVEPGDWYLPPEQRAPFPFNEAWRCSACGTWSHASAAVCDMCHAEKPRVAVEP